MIQKAKRILHEHGVFFILCLGIVIVGSVSVALLVLVPGTGEEKNNVHSSGNETQEEHFVSQGHYESAWDGIKQSQTITVGFNPSASSTVNRPVKGQLQVQFDPEATSIPQTINVYRILPMFETRKEFEEMAARCGVQGRFENMGIRSNAAEVIYITDMDMLWFEDKSFDENSELDDLPSKEEASDIAWNHARRLGLLCPQAEVIATSDTSIATEQTNNELVTSTIDVVIGCKLDGYEVRGPGMQLRMSIGSGGKLDSIADCLRRLELYGTYNTKPIAKALDEAQQGTGTVNLQPEVENPVVSGFSILYYAEPAMRENRALFPVYAFMGPDCCIYVPVIGERINN